MRFVIQRVKEASVTVEQEVIGKIGHGLLVFVGVSDTDDKQIADKMIDKLTKLRIFDDEEGKTNLSAADVNGEFLNTYHADGIIVATPTGSTGYNMSAGGPIVDPKGKLLLLTPNNAHNLNSKSIVLSADDVIEIEMGSRRRQKDEVAYVSFDGDIVAELEVGDRFVIRSSDNFTRICKINKRSFLEILRKKMETYT